MGWDYFVVLIISSLLSYALSPRPATPQPATLEDFQFPQVNEGTPQVVVFGDCWLEGWTVLSYGDLRSDAITSGGKK